MKLIPDIDFKLDGMGRKLGELGAQVQVGITNSQAVVKAGIFSGDGRPAAKSPRWIEGENRINSDGTDQGGRGGEEQFSSEPPQDNRASQWWWARWGEQ